MAEQLKLIITRVSEEIKTFIRQKAFDNFTSQSMYIRKLIEKEMKKYGNKNSIIKSKVDSST